jgi:hypothetical protein
MRGLALPPAPLGQTSPGLAAADRSPLISRRRAMHGRGGEPSRVADPERSLDCQPGEHPTNPPDGRGEGFRRWAGNTEE